MAKCVIGSGKNWPIGKIHFIDVYYSYTYDLPFHTDKVAIDDHVCYSRWQIPGCQLDPVSVWLLIGLSFILYYGIGTVATSLAHNLAKSFYQALQLIT